MNKYKILVNLHHIFTANEEVEMEIEAENKDEARTLARDQAYEDCDPHLADIEHEQTGIDNIEFLSCEDLHKPRCQKTFDLFAEFPAHKFI